MGCWPIASLICKPNGRASYQCWNKKKASRTVFGLISNYKRHCLFDNSTQFWQKLTCQGLPTLVLVFRVRHSDCGNGVIKRLIWLCFIAHTLLWCVKSSCWLALQATIYSKRKLNMFNGPAVVLGNHGSVSIGMSVGSSGPVGGQVVGPQVVGPCLPCSPDQLAGDHKVLGEGKLVG